MIISDELVVSCTEHDVTYPHPLCPLPSTVIELEAETIPVIAKVATSISDSAKHPITIEVLISYG
jgi:hypothetical protein